MPKWWSRVCRERRLPVLVHKIALVAANVILIAINAVLIARKK